MKGDISDDPEFNREIFVTVLNGHLNRQGSSRRDFALQLGITPVYLALIRNLDSNSLARRVPSENLVRRVLDALPTSDEENRFLLDRFRKFGSPQSAPRVLWPQKKNVESPEVAIISVKKSLTTAEHATRPEDARKSYRVVLDETSHLLSWIKPNVDPISFVQLCLVRHSVQCVLNRPDDALWHAGRARWVLERFDLNGKWRSAEVPELLVQSILAEGIALHNLGNDAWSVKRCEEAEELIEEEGLEKWRPQLARDKILAMAELPRFGIREVDRQIDLTITSLSSGEFVEDDRALLLFLSQEARARALTSTRTRRGEAEELLQELSDFAAHGVKVGPLHRVALLQTQARFNLATGNAVAGEEALWKAIDVAERAGLIHQIVKMRRKYSSQLGATVDEIVARNGPIS